MWIIIGISILLYVLKPMMIATSIAIAWLVIVRKLNFLSVYSKEIALQLYIQGQ